MTTGFESVASSYQRCGSDPWGSLLACRVYDEELGTVFKVVGSHEIGLSRCPWHILNVWK